MCCYWYNNWAQCSCVNLLQICFWPLGMPFHCLLSPAQPMKMQHDSFEERIESPEPLYEEVGDFGLQVLKSLETSFLSSAHAETQEVPARPISLGQRKAASLDRMVGSNPVHSLSSSGQSLDTLSQEDSLHVPGRHRSHRSCSPQQELLLQELSTMFCKKPESEEQHTTDWEPHLILQTRQIPTLELEIATCICLKPASKNPVLNPSIY